MYIDGPCYWRSILALEGVNLTLNCLPFYHIGNLDKLWKDEQIDDAPDTREDTRKTQVGAQGDFQDANM